MKNDSITLDCVKFHFVNEYKRQWIIYTDGLRENNELKYNSAYSKICLLIDFMITIYDVTVKVVNTIHDNLNKQYFNLIKR